MASYPAYQTSSRENPPHAFLSTYAPRIRTYGNALLTPVIPQTAAIPVPRTTKRGTTAINYAEDGFDDDDFDDSEGRRRPTGLRSLRKEDSSQDLSAFHAAQLGKELTAPVEIQGVWREWMAKPKRLMTDKQCTAQAALPLVLIPIRIDLDIQPFRPDRPLPLPHNAREMGVDETAPAYRTQEMTPAYRLKDSFLWNLHEGVITPDMFAKGLVDELDFPPERKNIIIGQIVTQIRTQLEEYAGVALHPLFDSGSAAHAPSLPPTAAATTAPASQLNGVMSQTSTPAPTTSRSTPFSNVIKSKTPAPSAPATPNEAVTVSATMPRANEHDPDDAYRCIINLSINLTNRLYSDKFEWSLLHPVGFAENFARVTCADLGLASEWVGAMAHAIYEAVLRLKKEVCENGGLVGGDIDNDAAEGVASGWRYEPERLAADWEPQVEVLSKEEIERREVERERQMRRLRRETARFSSTTNIAAMGSVGNSLDYFGDATPGGEQLGRGERTKKKRRFRSLSPLGRETPDAGGYGGAGGNLADWERANWRCSHCMVWGTAVWAVRDGPAGPRTLCHNCGFLYERDKVLPPASKELFAVERPVGIGPVGR
ncbi:SNF5-domain-containing protein [Trichodelitschia bisporula]|uniref:SNF5-domain-containing protein n=1 Tax=Trichodelitschia bisporula TaxID=703511 RepID=A0A6G1HZ00_9PEZI|nr:SNF5-domain-containing protein [Trichodelitschia bisporula]